MPDISFSYTNRDLESVRQQGMSQIPIVSNQNWTDLNPTDPGIVLIDYVHALVDMIEFYQDHQALETYLATAQERKNIFKLAKQISYKVKSAGSSSVEVTFYLVTPISNNIKIPANTRLAAAPSSGTATIAFLTTEDVYLYSGQLSVTVSAIQGEIKTQTYVGTGVCNLTPGVTGSENQIITLPDDLVNMDHITVVDDTGEEWSPIDFISFADTDEKVYELYLTPDDKVNIEFGNGTRGKVPQTTDTFRIEYLKTLGTAGNVGANKITVISDTIYDSAGSPVGGIKVKNEQASVGGKNPQTEDEIRDQAPLVRKTSWRAVTSKDYEVLAQEVPGVKSAKALDVRTAPDLCLHQEVKVILVPEGGGTPSKYLKDQVFEYLYQRSIPPTVLQVIGPIYRDFDLSVTVTRDQKYNEEEVVYNIQQALESYFSTDLSSFGVLVRYRSLITILSTVIGVKYLEDLSLNSDVQLNPTELARLGVVSVNATKGV